MRATPPDACDCHIHVFDARFPAVSGVLRPNCTVPDYRVVQGRIGTTRTVVVSPRPYVTDHACTLDAIAQLGAAVTRGVAVVRPEVTDAELERLHAGGIRGIRFTLGNPAVAVTTVDMIEPLARRVAELGWHVQLNMKGEQIVAHADLLQRIAAPMVFDHMGRLPQPAGIRHAAFDVIGRLLDAGRAWVKLTSVVYSDGDAQALGEVARAYVRIAPERMLWGSDWPHGGKEEKPDDAVLFDRLAHWAGDESTRRRILVDNPQRLYGF